MKKLNLYILLLGSLLATQVLTGQKADKPADLLPPTTSFIPDDDGGVVEIVPAELTSPGSKKANASPVLKSIQPLSIFMGNIWAEQNLGTRKASLFDLGGHLNLATLRDDNVGVLPAAPSVDDLADLPKEPINDLWIQRKLVDMLESKILPTPDAGTVFVVFLPPGVKLTVGSHTAGMHFAAYHNLIHVESGELRYVVVPFNENADRQATVATLAIVQTIFNPGSN
jgi:hypothetical protein